MVDLRVHPRPTREGRFAAPPPEHLVKLVERDDASVPCYRADHAVQFGLPKSMTRAEVPVEHRLLTHGRDQRDGRAVSTDGVALQDAGAYSSVPVTYAASDCDH